MPAPDQDFLSDDRLDPAALRLPVPASQAVIEAGAEGFHLDYFKIARKYLLLTALLAVLGTIGGALSVVVTPPTYKVKALLEVQPMSGSVLKMRETQEYVSNSDVDLLTESQILSSDTFLRQVLQRLRMDNISSAPVQAGFFGKIRRALKLNTGEQLLEASSIEGMNSELMPKAVVMAVHTLKVDPVNGTHLLELTCESTSPQFAAYFLNTLTDTYIEHNYQERMETVRTTTQWISGQLNEAKSKMNAADEQLREFVRSSGDAFVTQKNTLAESKLQDLQAKLAAAQSDLIAKQALYDLVQKTPPDSLPNIIDDPNVRQYQLRIADLRREEATLTTTLTNENPKVKAIEAQIADLQVSQRKELNYIIKRIENQYEAAKRNQDLLRASYSTVAAQVGDQAGKAAQYENLKKESDSAHQAYQALLLQSDEASVAGSLPINNIQTIDRAVPPQRPYKPKPIMNLGAGAALGLAMSCGIAFLREKFDQRVSSPNHARQLLSHVRQLGVIPSLEENSTRRHFLPNWRKALPGELSIGKAAMPVEGQPMPSQFIVSSNPFLSESFRVTLASLTRESAGLPWPKVILVTSPGAEEGKTTVASNLAVALAETGRRVVIVDADFRRPRAHKVFGMANTRGLVDVLTEEKPLVEYPVEELSLRTSLPNIHLIPNGSQPQNIPKLLYSRRFPELIQRLKMTFDTVLLDGPPMLRVADARIMSSMADGVILVLRSGVTETGSTREAIEQLQADGAVILGTVLNDWKPTKGEAKKSQYYSTFDSYDRT